MMTGLPQRRATRSVLGISLLFSGFAGAGPLAGCSVASDVDSVDHGEVPAAHGQLAKFVLHLSPSHKTWSISPVTPDSGGPRVSPASENDVTLCQDGTPGSNDPTKCSLAPGTQTVELVTDQASIQTSAGCPAPYQTSSFCANVTLDSFWKRSLPYGYAQATSITDSSGMPLSGHSALNSDPALYGLSNALGLWSYSSPSAAPPSTSETFLGQSPFNTASREWVFANPDDADTYVSLRVMAATTFSTYSFQSLLQPYVDACTGGTVIPVGTVQSTQALPFPFTLYATTYDGSTAALAQTVTFSSTGVITLGGTANTTSGTNVQLPSCVATPCAAAPKPAIFAFWDTLSYGKGANAKGMCFKTGGSAPNRYAAISWNSMRVSGTSATKLTFGAVLHEGTNNVDLVYNTMHNGAPAAGNGATVGVQDETGTVATATFHAANYPTNTSQTLVPSP